MKCKQVTEMLDGYCRNQLSEADKKQLEAHLSACEHCRQAVKAYRFFLTEHQLEEDFSPPRNLNAQIYYTLSHAKKEAPIPFWRKKQSLAYATAVSFLLLAGIWGGSYYQEMKEALPVPQATVIEQTLSQNETPAPSPVPSTEAILTEEAIPKTPTKTPAPKPTAEVIIPKSAVTEPPIAEATQNEPIPESYSEDAPPSEATADTANAPLLIAETAEEALPAYTPEESEQTPMMMRGRMLADTEADAVIPDCFREKILADYPCVQLGEALYQVDITIAELEAILGQAVSIAEEEKTPLVLQFTAEDEE